MKILKRILIGLLVLVAILLVTALFIKKDYAVKREITINKPNQEVFDYIKYLRNQDFFSKWAMMDPNMQKTYSGTDGTVGFISAWDSKLDSVGKGEQEILKIDNGKRIDFEIRFIKPFESKDKAYMITEPVSPTATKVSWGFDGHMNYPMNLMLLCMDFDKMLGGDLEVGLQRLKTNLETNK
ncbi:SRPBCC family protein [Sphingobacterium sp. SRCM116780]|uniref:SRPBCC family protein n=1 Tax=Sphingobacterium sp. SRCM116780 TaxID=2907623 RepID=UPI001F26CD65|nr:SRPBCC family protein [Sphingobacterium sp. SRCM116780]UIR54997.1 SRPBCC family protein [Sphingobacterium sp. SRCM116780]